MQFCRWKNGILSFHGVAEMKNREWFTQLPFLLVVSVCGGLLGALFNWLHEKIFLVRDKMLNTILISSSFYFNTYFLNTFTLHALLLIVEFWKKCLVCTFQVGVTRQMTILAAILFNSISRYAASRQSIVIVEISVHSDRTCIQDNASQADH